MRPKTIGHPLVFGFITTLDRKIDKRKNKGKKGNRKKGQAARRPKTGTAYIATKRKQRAAMKI